GCLTLLLERVNLGLSRSDISVQAGDLSKKLYRLGGELVVLDSLKICLRWGLVGVNLELPVGSRLDLVPQILKSLDSGCAEGLDRNYLLVWSITESVGHNTELVSSLVLHHHNEFLLGRNLVDSVGVGSCLNLGHTQGLGCRDDLSLTVSQGLVSLLPASGSHIGRHSTLFRVLGVLLQKLDSVSLKLVVLADDTILVRQVNGSLLVLLDELVNSIGAGLVITSCFVSVSLYVVQLEERLNQTFGFRTKGLDLV